MLWQTARMRAVYLDMRSLYISRARLSHDAPCIKDDFSVWFLCDHSERFNRKWHKLSSIPSSFSESIATWPLHFSTKLYLSSPLINIDFIKYAGRLFLTTFIVVFVCYCESHMMFTFESYLTLLLICYLVSAFISLYCLEKNQGLGRKRLKILRRWKKQYWLNKLFWNHFIYWVCPLMMGR